jgi:hypothetical protein
VIKRGATQQSPHNVFIYLSGHAILDANGQLQAVIKNKENEEPDTVEIDKFVTEISKRVNCHVNALLDTSKKRPETKGSNQDNKRIVKKEKLAGGMHKYSLDHDSEKTQTVDMQGLKISQMTYEWLSYMRGNPGGQYPDILKDF